jgi:hypothetical protein
MVNRTRRTFGTLFALCVVTALAAWSCEQAGGALATPAGPTSSSAAANSGGSTATTAPDTASSTEASKLPPVDEATLIAMTRALQDEYHAEWAYQDVLDAFGNVSPFTSIHQAELKHIEAASKLFTKRGLAVPASDWSAVAPLEFESVAAACASGVEAETLNISMYDELLGATPLPDDVVKVFQKLRLASLNSHLPAFVKCASK